MAELYQQEEDEQDQLFLEAQEFDSLRDRERYDREEAAQLSAIRSSSRSRSPAEYRRHSRAGGPTRRWGWIYADGRGSSAD
eukprot:8700806-Alexandrium_andersonii.AAC.1